MEANQSGCIIQCNFVTIRDVDMKLKSVNVNTENRAFDNTTDELDKTRKKSYPCDDDESETLNLHDEELLLVLFKSSVSRTTKKLRGLWLKHLQ